MSSDLAWWGGWVGLLAVEIVLLVGSTGLVATRFRSAQYRRVLWQACLLAIAVAGLAELVGVRQQLPGLDASASGPRTVLIRQEDPPESAVVARATGASGIGRAAPGRPGQEAATVRAWPAWVWLAGVLGFGLRSVIAQGLLWRRALTGRTAAGAVMRGNPRVSLTVMDALRVPLGLGPVRLLVWDELRGPVAFGVWRPTVAIPADFTRRFAPAQQEAMLAHELAHLAAQDPLWLWVVDAVCALMWWHPAVWWARRQLRAASEAAADEASALVPAGRVALAESLVACGRELTAVGGLGVGGSGLRSELARRVERLLQDSTEWRRLGALPGWLLRVAGLILAIGLAWVPVGLAGEPSPWAVLMADASDAQEPVTPVPGLAPAAPSSPPRPEPPAPSADSTPPSVVSNPPQQILLKTLLVELPAATDGHSDDLGLDWLFGLSPTNNPVLEVVSPTGDLPGAKAALAESVRVERLITTGEWAVLTKRQYDTLRKRMESLSQVDVLAAPSVTTLSGRQAQVQVADSVNLALGPRSVAATSTNQATLVYETEPVMVGPSVDLLPTLVDGHFEVSVKAQVSEFLGYDAPPKGSVVTGRDERGKVMKGTPALPRLRVREAKAETRCQPGEILILRGPWAERISRFKDEVSGLGKVPLLGRMFRREGTVIRRTRLYVFIEPAEVTATGEPVKP